MFKAAQISFNPSFMSVSIWSRLKTSRRTKAHDPVDNEELNVKKVDAARCGMNNLVGYQARLSFLIPQGYFRCEWKDFHRSTLGCFAADCRGGTGIGEVGGGVHNECSEGRMRRPNVAPIPKLRWQHLL